MRVSTTALFQGLNGLRRIVDELQDALAASNDEVVRLAGRVKDLETELNELVTHGPPRTAEIAERELDAALAALKITAESGPDDPAWSIKDVARRALARMASRQEAER